MTSKAYCFYCYESLSASFENREPPTLEHIVQLYDEYTAKDKDGATEADDPTEDEDEEDTISIAPTNPSISRLQKSSHNSSSRSSSTSASTPSILSASSSQSQLPSTTTSSTTSSTSISTPLTSSYPLFVTWNSLSPSGSKSLRGCIGTFDPLPLSTGLRTYALTSAFDDTRFSPIRASLLHSLSCNLTLLADFEAARDPLDWSLGIHGLRISFTYRGRRCGATYLPDVAVEQGWGKEEAVESLMRKAGWDGGRGSRRLVRGVEGKPWESDGVGEFRTVRYTGLMSSADYAEWDRFRKWMDAKA